MRISTDAFKKKQVNIRLIGITLFRKSRNSIHTFSFLKASLKCSLTCCFYDQFRLFQIWSVKYLKLYDWLFFQELNTKLTWAWPDHSMTALLNILLITLLILEENGLKQRATDYCGLILFISIIWYVMFMVNISVNNLTTNQNKQFMDVHF